MSKNIIPSDLGAPFDVVKALSELGQRAIVRPNNPPAGIGGYLFDIPGDEWVELQSYITDHFVEDNTAINDQWALAPEQITLNGMVAELASGVGLGPDVPPPPDPLPANIPMMPVMSKGSLTNQLKALASNAVRTGIASVLSGTGITGALKNAGSSVVANVQSRVTDTALGAIRTLLQPDMAAALVNPGIALPADGQNAVNLLKTTLPKNWSGILDALKLPGTPNAQALLASSQVIPQTTGQTSTLYQFYQDKQPTNASRQSSAYLYFDGLRRSRQLVSVETAWGIFTDMALLSFRADQSEETADQSNFTLVFKKLRFAKPATVALGQLSGRAVSQYGQSSPSNNGQLGQPDLTADQGQSILAQAARGP